MSSSNELLQEFARTLGAGDPGFVAILAFDYYDGPEHGLALYPSGEGVRFSTLGDSKSRMFRAFELIPIRGNWWSEVKALQAARVDPPRRITLPSEDSETLTRLERDVLGAPGTGHYVGVGSPNLERISVSAVSEEQLAALRQLDCSPAGFQSAHQLVKRRAADVESAAC